MKLFIILLSVMGIGIIYPFYKLNGIEKDWFIFILTILFCLNVIAIFI